MPSKFMCLLGICFGPWAPSWLLRVVEKYLYLEEMNFNISAGRINVFYVVSRIDPSHDTQVNSVVALLLYMNFVCVGHAHIWLNNSIGEIFKISVSENYSFLDYVMFHI